MYKDFQKFAMSRGVSSLKLHNFKKAMTPYIIEERELNVAQMDVFSRLMMDRTIFLGTEVDSIISNVIIAQLLYLQSVNSREDIQLFINSPGGSVYDGLGIYDTMQFVSNDVATTCVGMAASMGAFLLAAGEKGKRSALPNARIMLHQLSSGAVGTHADLKIHHKECDILQNKLYDILTHHTGKSLEQVTIDCDRDLWLSVEEAKSYGDLGIIDNIIKK